MKDIITVILVIVIFILLNIMFYSMTLPDNINNYIHKDKKDKKE